MKKSVCLLALFLLMTLLPACQTPANETLPDDAETQTMQPTETSALVTISPVSPSPSQLPGDEPSSEVNEPVDEAEWAAYLALTSDDPMAICNLFPDPYFSADVAALLDKRRDEATTFEELASYTGELSCRVGELKSLEGIGYLTGLTYFSCCKNEVRTLPAEIRNLVNLKTLDLCKAYDLESLPPEIGHLTSLTYLHIGLTSVKILPPEIGRCRALRVMQLSNTQIQTLPEEIGQLTNLEWLDIHSLDIEEIPDSLCRLTNLKYLDIGYTGLKDLPKNIGNLANLEWLDLFGCQLKTLPASMKNLKKLVYLNVYDNFALNEAYMDWFPSEVYELPDGAYYPMPDPV